ncbi:hypothetical protein [Quadrisphaera sp. INWT6]|uniref:hypothetical protein n=1 Tax=Quadrisphaera sp. INWT6 TaxID=2596917 RepID=UPI002107BD6E|nr:hypothetical protein [Quadrisphaera sp. INWT6]
MSNDLAGWVAVRDADVVPVAGVAIKALDAITVTEKDAALAVAAESRAAHRSAVALLVGCSLLAVLVAVAIGVVVARSVTRP